MKSSKPYKDHKVENLKDKAYAQAYLEAAVEEYHRDHNRSAFLVALKDLVEARGGIAKFAEKIQVSRQALYKMFSPQGNPRFDTMESILYQLGFQFMIQPVSKRVVSLKKKVGA